MKNTLILTLVACVPFVAEIDARGDSTTFAAISLSPDNRGQISILGSMPSDGWPDVYKTDFLVFSKVTNGTNDIWISVFETTNGQWDHIMESNPSFFTNSTVYATRPVESLDYYAICGESGFLRTLNQMVNTGSFRIPTESEWVDVVKSGYADVTDSLVSTETCRCNDGTFNTKFWDYKPSTISLQEALFEYNSPANEAIFRNSLPKSTGTIPVGSYSPDKNGVYDLFGNVAEWCLDDGSDIVKHRSIGVLKGGYWLLSSEWCNREERFFAPKDGKRSNTIGYGFRLLWIPETNQLNSI